MKLYSDEFTYIVTRNRKYLYVNGVGKYYNKLTTLTLYVFPYVVATSTGYIKHIYSGSERIVSKIGTGGLSKINFHIKQQSEWQPKQESSKAHLKRTLQDGITRPVEDSDITTNRLNILYNQMYASGTESEIYYYSTDHLGSSSWITNTAGAPIQHLQYLPFGGNYINQRTSDWNSMYTFSGKERDSETGFSYFGARYYDSGLGIWLSVDPMSGKYPGLSPYVYAANNPVKYIDPDGMEIDKYGTMPNLLMDSKTEYCRRSWHLR